ncbi:hypothetical protein V2J09_003466 [Rumex salicifolius]
MYEAEDEKRLPSGVRWADIGLEPMPTNILEVLCIRAAKVVAKWIPWAEYWYNSNFQGAIERTTFESVYARLPSMIHQFLHGDFIIAMIVEGFWNRDEVLRKLMFNLKRAQKWMSVATNKKRRDVEFKEGNLVFLKFLPHRQSTLLSCVNQKLAARYYGLFQIVRRIGAVAYDLRLPSHTRIYPIFHVSLLKCVVGNHKAIVELPPGLVVADEEFVPENILEVHKRPT